MARGPVLTVTLTADDDKLKGKLNGSSAEIEGWGKKVSGFAVGAGAAVTTMAINAIPQLIGMGAEMVGLGQEAELYNTKASTVFGENADDIKKWADGVNESMGLSDEAVVGMAAGLGDLLVPMGFTREAAADMSKETIGLSGALSAWSGGQYDAAAVSDILTKAYLGETDGLKALGISISAAETDQRALEIAQADGREEVTAMDKALANQQLIMEKSTDAQAAWADGSMDSVKAQNEMKASIADVKTSIGTALLPMVQKATSWIVNSFIPGVKNLIETFKKNWPEIQAAVQPVLQWFQDTISDVVLVVTALWDLFGSNLLRYAKDTWNNIKNVIEGVILVIKGIIDLVMGILTGDWEKAWEGIKGIVTGVWKAIEGIINQALNFIRTVISNAWTVIKTLTTGVWGGIRGAITGAINGAKDAVTGAVNAIKGFLSGAWAAIKGTASSAWNGIKGTISGIWEGIKGAVRSGIDYIVTYVRGLPGRITSAVSGAFDGLVNQFKAVINRVISIWNNFKFPTWTLPSVSVMGKKIGGGSIGGWGTPNIPYLAKGTNWFPGGMAWVGENGPELVGLPRGSSVSTANQSRRMASGGGGNTIIQNFPAGTRPDDVVQAQKRWERRNGPR